MLTKSDLKQIGTIVRDQVDEVVEEKLSPIRGGITSIKGDLISIKGDVKYLKKKVNRIDRTVSLVVKNYDEGDVRQHLYLPENN